MATMAESSSMGPFNPMLSPFSSIKSNNQDFTNLLNQANSSANAYLHPSVVHLLQQSDRNATPGLLETLTNSLADDKNLMSDAMGMLDSPTELGTSAAAALASMMDARRMRKSVFRRTIDYNAPVMNHMENRVWMKDARDIPAIQSDYLYQAQMPPVFDCLDNPYVSITTKHVRTSTNKNKCPIYCVCWTPEGRRLITGAHSGEFTLWNGLTFNFETILQAHDHPIRAMKWTNNEEWLITADQTGFVKYWQTNMNNVTAFSAHKESAIRGVSFCPTDDKFVTCSDDATVRVWDFYTHAEERVLRGHGADVRCVAWHPQSSLVISGSKDAQQPIKLWDPKVGESILTLYAHKNTCTDVAWNKNGNWFITSSRDHLIKMFDLRHLKHPMETFRGHKRDVMRLAWHPFHENMFTSGSGDGAILFWLVGNEKNVGSIDDAHESMIWSLAWHPLGHILVSGANDFTTKFWTRNRPGDLLRDTATLQGTHAPLLSTQEGSEIITGTTPQKLHAMHPPPPPPPTPPVVEMEMKIVVSRGENDLEENMISGEPWPTVPSIPGLGEGQVVDHHLTENAFDEYERLRSLRASRAIPKQFMVNWASTKHFSMPSAIGMGSGGMALIGSAAAQNPLPPPVPRVRMMTAPMGTPPMPVRPRLPPVAGGMLPPRPPAPMPPNRMRMLQPSPYALARGRMMPSGFPMRGPPIHSLPPPRMMMRGGAPSGRPYLMPPHDLGPEGDSNYYYDEEENYGDDGGYDDYYDDPYGDNEYNYDDEGDEYMETDGKDKEKNETNDKEMQGGGGGGGNNHVKYEPDSKIKSENIDEQHFEDNQSTRDLESDDYGHMDSPGDDNNDNNRNHSQMQSRRMPSGPPPSDRYPHPYARPPPPQGPLRPSSRSHPPPMYNQPMPPRRPPPMYPPGNQQRQPPNKHYYPNRRAPGPPY